MEWTSLNDLRKIFLDFFASKDHKVLKSFSLIPENDKSLLLINSGMAPMKKYFTGEVTPPKKRVTTCQKCIRTPDIDRVGITARHGTFFEMLGNFSFGDYFKKEAIAWAWEFCTEVIKLPKEKLWVSVYEEDDETVDIWVNNIGLPADRIVKLGKEDNFWEHGAGPCGPCSEIYFDRGEKYGCGSPDCSVGCECDRYIEFWNLVFTQFNNDGHNNYTPLEHPNIDTGMGLERLACIVQNVDNLFLVDSVQNIIRKVSEISGVKYGENEKKDVSLRVVTDHMRSAVFMISDGVMPSNEGRGYVLRSLIRRAVRHGRNLGITHDFTTEVCEAVIKENEEMYPELSEKHEILLKVVANEEQAFDKTLNVGLQMLNDLIDKSQKQFLSAENAFKLSDTYGLPLDVTKDILRERGMTVDNVALEKLISQQKQLARESRKKFSNSSWNNDTVDISDIKKTRFCGYDKITCEATVLAIIKNGEKVEKAVAGNEVTVIFDETPLYAESGGQVGDTGKINTEKCLADIVDTQKNSAGIFFHRAIVKVGELRLGEKVDIVNNILNRNAIAKNHTGAHLLHAALRKVLGSHVEQAGQLVDDTKLRFDFTHFSPLSKEEIEKINFLVNAEILDAVEITTEEMPIEKAKAKGAMALFGEKYSDIVRVVSSKDGFTSELCGGTHVSNTAKLGMLKIISESSVAAGVRRITAVTGIEALNLFDKQSKMISDCVEVLKLNDDKDLVSKCQQLVEENKNKDKEINLLNEKIAEYKLSVITANFRQIKGVRLITAIVKDSDSKALRTLGDQIKSKRSDCIAVIAGICDGKANFVCVAGHNAVKNGIHCGNIIKAIAKITGANGGGRPDFAMSGVKDVSKIEDALKQADKIVGDYLERRV